MAKLTLIANLPNGEYLLNGYSHQSDKRIRIGETVDCVTELAIGFIGASEFKVSFESGELDNIEDRKLKRVVKLGQFKDVAALKSELSPKQKSFVSKVLPKKATKEEKVVEEVLKEPANEKTLEESSDEATLANDSE